MVRGLVIPADDEQPLREIDVSVPDAVAQAVGGLMEAVDLIDFGATVYVNESGVLQRMPFNSRATFLWWYYVPSSRGRARLVGDAIIVGLPDDDGADSDLPDAAHQQLLSQARYRVEVQIENEPIWRRLPLTYPDYWEALMWAALLLQQIPDAADTRVIPVGLIENAAAA
ncbi:DUF3846 domain-containing protein [Microbacterium sp. NPDC060117]|uniref:DUF3846 domain-containing protein n=1 Tax=Microbacterium sp. NPDC060117 TaxID=3347057 RepID=UPI0036681C75